VHPRLFYTNNDFERIKKEAAAGGLRDDALQLVIADADKTLKEEIPEFNSAGRICG